MKSRRKPSVIYDRSLWLLLATALAIPTLALAQTPREEMLATLARHTETAVDDLLRNRLADDQDILSYAAAHPRDSLVTEPDGTMRRPKFGDPQLEDAETFLTPRFSRPWTVTTVLARLRASTDAAMSAHLLRVLAASRHPRAALVLGEALRSDLSIPACYGLLDYFPVPATMGGTEEHMRAADRWFTAYKGKLQKGVASK